MTPRVIVVAGPAGAGKTTVGHAVADALGWRFAEADDFHAPESVTRMRRGDPLGDADRWPWLDRLRAEIAGALAAGAPLVLACSALRRAYRGRLVPAGAAPGDVRFVLLAVSPESLARRLAGRAGHFAGPALLATQLAALEPPTPAEDVITVDGDAPVDTVVARVREVLGV